MKKRKKRFFIKGCPLTPNVSNIMKKTIFIILTLIFISCKTNQTRNKLKVGRWVYSDTVNNVCYKSFGKYQKNKEKGTWKSFEGATLVKTEKYKKDYCIATTYHKNGQIASRGTTKIAESENDTHWYYYGEWNFYDENGKLLDTKIYEKEDVYKEIKPEN
jgi:hypothetical protein